MYSIGDLIPCDFTQEKVIAIGMTKKLATTNHICIFKKLYFHDMLSKGRTESEILLNVVIGSMVLKTVD